MPTAAIQARGRAVITPLGLVYNTTMSRPDAALALASIHVGSTKAAVRVSAVCVTGAGFGAAVFCDVIARFYQPRVGGGNTSFAVGFAADGAAADPAMVTPVLNRKKDNGDPQYARSILRVGDTSLPDALIRNGVTLTTQGAIVLSAPATALAKSLTLAGTKEIYKQRIKRLVIVDTGAARQDAAALTKILAEWPTPIYVIGADVGAALQFPGARLDALFAWTPAHPAADAYRAFKPMPYDAPLFDLAAVDFAITPDADYFVVSEPGSLSLGGDNALKFSPGAGQVRKVAIDPAKRPQALDALITSATTQPTPSPIRGRGTGE